MTGATLFTLSALVDKSLLMRVGADRFKFHELVRQFGQEKLLAEADQHTLILDAHCQYYANLMKHYEETFKAEMSALGTSIPAVHGDFDNILAGWHRALETQLVDEIGKYIFTISTYFSIFHLNSEAVQTFGQALHLFADGNSPTDASVRMRLMTHYSWYVLFRGQFEQAHRILEEALEVSRGLEDSHAADVGFLMGFLGQALYLDGEPDEGRESAKEGLQICQTIKFQFGVWLCLSVLGELESNEGCYEAAYDYHRMALSYSEQQKSFLNIPYNLGALGWICCVLGKTDESLTYLRRCLTTNRNLLSIDPVIFTILGIAELHEQRAQPDTALELLAILLHHPQYSPSRPSHPSVGSRARGLLARLQARFSPDYISTVMERAKQGEPSSRDLDPNFIVTPELVDRLLEMLNEVEKL